MGTNKTPIKIELASDERDRLEQVGRSLVARIATWSVRKRSWRLPTA